MKCWAAELGGCGKGKSQEHFVSKCILPVGIPIYVRGFDWCKNEFRESSKSALTSQILCRIHNEMLTKTDETAGANWTKIEKCMRLVGERAESETKRWPHISFDAIDPPLFERWFLKTLLNFYVAGKMKTNADYLPPLRLVNLAFGISRFKAPMGLHTIIAEREVVRDSDLFQTGAISVQGRELSGGLFTFRDLRFLIWLEEGPIPATFDPLMEDKRDWTPGKVERHSSVIYWNVNNQPSHSLRFNWK